VANLESDVYLLLLPFPGIISNEMEIIMYLVATVWKHSTAMSSGCMISISLLIIPGKGRRIPRKLSPLHHKSPQTVPEQCLVAFQRTKYKIASPLRIEENTIYVSRGYGVETQYGNEFRMHDFHFITDNQNKLFNR